MWLHGLFHFRQLVLYSLYSVHLNGGRATEPMWNKSMGDSSQESCSIVTHTQIFHINVLFSFITTVTSFKLIY